MQIYKDIERVFRERDFAPIPGAQLARLVVHEGYSSGEFNTAMALLIKHELLVARYDHEAAELQVRPTHKLQHDFETRMEKILEETR